MTSPPSPECAALLDDGSQCARPVRCKGLCSGHYQRLRTGRPVDGTLADGKRGCSVAGCAQKHHARGFCWDHWRRDREYGDPLGIRPEGEFTGYTGAHDRVKSKRGKAREYQCVDCGGRASDWSYIRGCADQQVQVGGTNDGDVYCEHIEHYEPRCKSCHRRYDGWMALTPEQDVTIRERYASGETIEALAVEYGVAAMTVHRRVKDISRGSRKLTDEQISSITTEYRDGATQRGLAHKYGVTRGAVQHHTHGIARGEE